MHPRRLSLVLLFALVGCPEGTGDDGDETDVPTDTEPVDTDDGEVDDTDDTTPHACDADDACAGCEPEGDAFTCDCSATIADEPSTCRPIRVAILDDDVDVMGGEPYSSGARLRPLLAAATWDGSAPMFTVIDVGRRWLWRGQLEAPGAGEDTGAASDTDASGDLLDIDNTDVVFLLEGIDYISELHAEGAAVLAAFVAAGGGLVRAEWGASYGGLVPELCPVTPYDDYIEDTTPKTWSLVPASGAAAAIVQDGLPQTFELVTSIARAEVKTAEQTGDVAPETLLTVAYGPDEDAPQVPAVVYWPPVSTGDAPHGAIVWLNHDLAYLRAWWGGSPMEEEAFATLVRNAARAVAAGDQF